MNSKRLPIPAAAAVLAALAAAPAAPAITVTESHPIRESLDLEVRCGAVSTGSVAIPAGARNVRLTSPAAGSVPPDGFGRPGGARVDAVRVLPGRIEVSATGVNGACSPVVTKFGDSVTQAVGVEGTYETQQSVTPKVTEGKRPRVRPTRIMDAKWGPKSAWRTLRWRSWGGATAVATGTYTGRRILPDKRGFPQEYFIDYPVRVTLSRAVSCGDRGVVYTRIRTTFLKRTPADVRRQAEPPPGLCLKRG